MEAAKPFDSAQVRVAVVGTGTEVGKTHMSVALLHALTLRGYSAVGLKPVESGVGDGESDTSRLAAAGTFHVKHSAPYRFADPVSPHLAARRVGTIINLGRIVEWVAACAAPWTVVETAGGLLSPLAPGVTNLDLIRLLAPDFILLVGVDRLGVLHDVAACLLAMQVCGSALPRPLVLLQTPEVADSSTGTNAAELVALEITPDAVTLPRRPADDPSMVDAMVLPLDWLLARVQSSCFT